MELLLILSLILVNGVFVMSEMAVVSARKARLQQWADEGRSGAVTALALANSPAHFLSTTQIGITVITILSGALGEATLSKNLADRLGKYHAAPALCRRRSVLECRDGIAFVSLVLGELVPKRLALINPEAIASGIARPMQWLSKATFPLVRLMSLVTDLVLRFLGARPVTSRRSPKKRSTSSWNRERKPACSRSTSRRSFHVFFRLDDELITTVMTPRTDIVYFDLNESFEENRQKLLASAHSRFVLCRGGLDDVVGVLRAKALLDAAFRGKPLDFASEAARALYVPDTLTMLELLEAFKKHRQHLALVVDEYGELKGLVTMNDIMEALVGDVATVEDTTEPDIVQRDDGSWLVDGSIALERYRKAMGLEDALPGEELHAYRTLGGLAMKLLGRVPQVGDRFSIGGFRFEVVDMDENRVDKLLVTRVDPPGPTARLRFAPRRDCAASFRAGQGAGSRVWACAGARRGAPHVARRGRRIRL